MLSVFFSSMAFAVATFAVYLASRSPLDHRRTLLIITLLCFCVLSLGPIAFAINIVAFKFYVASIPLAFYVLLPSFFLYHQALVSVKPWHWTRSVRKHFYLVPLVSVLSVSILWLPDGEFHAMFLTDNEVSRFAANIGLAFFAAILVWIALSIL